MEKPNREPFDDQKFHNEPGQRFSVPGVVSKWHGHPRFYELLDEMAQLHSDKNHDYAGDADPLRNLRMCEACGITPAMGVAVRMTDKMSRLQSYMKQGNLKVRDEGIKDTLKDMAIYSLLCIILIEEAEKP